MRPADRAWLTLAVGVTCYEVAAFLRHDWELLSSAFDRYRAARPVLAHVAVIYLALHLLRRIPPRFDPLGRFTGALRKIR